MTRPRMKGHAVQAPGKPGPRRAWQGNGGPYTRGDGNQGRDPQHRDEQSRGSRTAGSFVLSGSTAPFSRAAVSRPPGRGAPGSKPRADEPRGAAPPGAGATRNDAGPGEQAPSSRAAASRAPRGGQHAADLAFGRNETFHVSALGKTDRGRVSTLLHASPRRAINPISVEGACAGSHDLDTCDRNALNISSPHLASPHNFQTKMRALAHYLGKTVNFRKFISFAGS